MSQEFAVRNRILAVELQNEHVLIATDQPYKNEWIANLRERYYHGRFSVYSSVQINYSDIWLNITSDVVRSVIRKNHRVMTVKMKALKPYYN